MSVRETTKRTRTERPANGLVLKDAPIEVGVAYLVETYGLHPQEAREKVLIAKGMKTPGGRVADE